MIPIFRGSQGQDGDAQLQAQRTPYPAVPLDSQRDYQQAQNGVLYASSETEGAGQQIYGDYSSSPPVRDQITGPWSQNFEELTDGSFASVGAFFGYHPDDPIQISSQHLPQSSQPLVDPFMNAPSQLQRPQHGYLSPSSASFKQSHSDGYRAQQEHEGNALIQSSERIPHPARLSGACVHCRNLKVKCEFSIRRDICNRCISGKKECIVAGRKPRRVPPKREELFKKLRDQEAIIKAQEADIIRLREALDWATRGASLQTDAEAAFNPSFAYHQPRSSRAENKDIQDWIDRARESANVSGYLEASSVDEHERLSMEENSEGELEEERYASPELLLYPSEVKARRPSPAVGTTLSPIGLLASSALSNKPRGGSNSSAGDEKDLDLGPANELYFSRGVSTNPELRWSVRESQPPPRILASSLVSPREVDKLFEIFFDRMNLSVSLLDPQIYSAQTTYWRSPFLFTVICAIASRYLEERPDLYSILMGFAKMEAGQALVAGLKSLELVAGYILLSLYPVPSSRWEEDRGWLMLGAAIRMATDLNLHYPSTAKVNNSQQAREVASRTRIWINCYNLDRSMSTQFGKPSTIKEDYIARNSKFWYKKSSFSYDIHLSAYTQLLRVMARFHEEIYSDPDAPTGLNMGIDFETVTQKYEQELLDHWAEWEELFERESDRNNLHCLYRIELLRLANAYSRLVILSFQFQSTIHKGLSRRDAFLQRCISTASSVVKIVVENMAPHPFLRTAPDAQFIFASFGCVFLLKLLRPRFGTVLEDEQRSDIIALVGRLIEVLQADEVAIDERHTPKLYARFLEVLLEKHAPNYKTPQSAQKSPETDDPGESEVNTMLPHTWYAPESPVYHPPIVTPPSPPRNGFAISFPEAASTMSSTFPEPLRSGSLNMNLEFAATEDFAHSSGDIRATMHAVSDPVFWDDMMMPGFSWTSTASRSDSFQQVSVAH